MTDKEMAEEVVEGLSGVPRRCCTRCGAVTRRELWEERDEDCETCMSPHTVYYCPACHFGFDPAFDTVPAVF